MIKNFLDVAWWPIGYMRDNMDFRYCIGGCRYPEEHEYRFDGQFWFAAKREARSAPPPREH